MSDRERPARRVAPIPRWGWLAVWLLAGCGTSNHPQSTSNVEPAKTVEAPAVRAESKNRKPATAQPKAKTVPAPLTDKKSPGQTEKKVNLAPPAGADSEPPQPVYRPGDERPRHDDEMLASLGIHLYESRRLKLYTDIDPKVAQTLPPVIDQAYQALVDYFGPLPPDRDRSEFQMTGYLIRDDALFREAGLIPVDLPPFDHGRHRRNEFWMREQKFDYYRRHLLIHEVTHCFMMTMPGVQAPVWYMEGMAECFGTHQMADDGTLRFRVMPTSPDAHAGSGRITAVHNEFVDGKAKEIGVILDFRPEEFITTNHYAWSWALCMFFDSHPRYHKRFRELGQFLEGNGFPDQFYRTFKADDREIATEWTLFVQNLQYGYDPVRAKIDFQPGTRLAAGDQKESIILADRGWQSTGVQLEAGRTYVVAATGRFQLAAEPKPWISESQGISFRYFNGSPLGLLMGCVRSEAGDAGGSAETMLKTFPVGPEARLTAPLTGTLYLRLNDEWNSLSDNQGQVSVRVQAE